MPTIDWNREVRDQMEFAWNVQFLPRIQGLTDDEYLWEPASECWSLRPDEAGQVHLERSSRNRRRHPSRRSRGA
ncbi:MAG: hypothetical protein QM753_17110 [Thermomicrobiales bacterium]